MWDWELVRRLLEQATKVGEIYSPGAVATDYHRHLVASGAAVVPDLDALLEEADDAEQALREADCMRIGPRNTDPITLGEYSLTPFGAELHSRLGGGGIVQVFQAMQVGIDRGDIERVLYQLD